MKPLLGVISRDNCTNLANYGKAVLSRCTWDFHQLLKRGLLKFSPTFPGVLCVYPLQPLKDVLDHLVCTCLPCNALAYIDENIIIGLGVRNVDKRIKGDAYHTSFCNVFGRLGFFGSDGVSQSRPEGDQQNGQFHPARKKKC